MVVESDDVTVERDFSAGEECDGEWSDLEEGGESDRSDCDIVVERFDVSSDIGDGDEAGTATMACRQVGCVMSGTCVSQKILMIVIDFSSRTDCKIQRFKLVSRYWNYAVEAQKRVFAFRGGEVILIPLSIERFNRLTLDRHSDLDRTLHLGVPFAKVLSQRSEELEHISRRLRSFPPEQSRRVLIICPDGYERHPDSCGHPDLKFIGPSNSDGLEGHLRSLNSRTVECFKDRAAYFSSLSTSQCLIRDSFYAAMAKQSLCGLICFLVKVYKIKRGKQDTCAECKTGLNEVGGFLKWFFCSSIDEIDPFCI